MLQRWSIVIGFGIAIWAFYGALLALGQQLWSMDTTLIVHAIGAPIGAAFFSWLYFRTYHFTSVLVTAVAFVAVSLALDFFVVAMFVQGSFEMFASVLGVWLPQALIFSATYLTGWFMGQRLTPAQT